MNYIKEDWSKYKERLEKYNYTPEQIQNVFKIRENKDTEQITKDQFDYLIFKGIIKRTRKLKKIRNLYVFDNKVWYLEHFEKQFCWCGIFN